MTNTNLEKLIPGEHFIYNNLEFICLDLIDGNYLAITAEPWRVLPFDGTNYDNCRNDWRNSSLRKVLNTEFLSLLDKHHLIKQTSDLIADNGDKAYGTSEDYVTILSCDQYRKYRDLVPLFDDWMWTLTPWTCDTPIASNVRHVNPTGYVTSHHASYGLGVAPACLFASENLKLRRQAQLVGISDEDD